jgi:type IV pilus assembly protein PilA
MERRGAGAVRLAHDQAGFSLVELLVVMLVIGVLAAIAIPSFFSQKDKGDDTGAESNARNLQTLVEACYTDTSDYSKCQTQAQIADSRPFNFGSGPGQVQVIPNPIGQGGVATLGISKTGTSFAIYSLHGDTERVCWVPSGESLPKGSCSANGPYASYGWGTW